MLWEALRDDRLWLLWTLTLAVVWVPTLVWLPGWWGIPLDAVGGYAVAWLVLRLIR
jgi:hypothetical protein